MATSDFSVVITKMKARHVTAGWYFTKDCIERLWKLLKSFQATNKGEKQLVMGYHFQARVLYLGTTVFWFIPLYLSSFLLAFIYISWFLAENVIFLERSIALPSFLYQLEFLNLFQIKQYTRTSTWNLYMNCPRCVFSSRLNIRLADYLKTT